MILCINLQAHNGSGKTTCFVLAMLSRVDPSITRTQALCVCPTRELVVQNLEVTQKMGKHTGISATSTARDDRDFPRSTSMLPAGCQQSCALDAHLKMHAPLLTIVVLCCCDRSCMDFSLRLWPLAVCCRTHSCMQLRHHTWHKHDYVAVVLVMVTCACTLLVLQLLCIACVERGWSVGCGAKD